MSAITHSSFLIKNQPAAQASQNQTTIASASASDASSFSDLLATMQAVNNATTTTTSVAQSVTTNSTQTTTSATPAASVITPTTATQTSSTVSNKPPSLQEFMQKTGADVDTAIHYVYGAVGAFTDHRDWTKIMASDDPLSAAKQATQELFTSSDAPVQTNDLLAKGYQPINSQSIIAQTDNLALVTNDDQPTYQLVTKDGFAFSSPIAVNNVEQLAQKAQAYNIDQTQVESFFNNLAQTPNATFNDYANTTWAQLLSRLKVSW